MTAPTSPNPRRAHALRRPIAGVLAAAALLAQHGTTEARTGTETPQTIDAALARARPGDRIVLAPGFYSDLKLGGKTFEPSLEIDASAATIRGVRLNRVTGVKLRGGRFELPPPAIRAKDGKEIHGAAIRLDNAHDIEISDATFVGPGRPGADVFGEGYGVFVRTGSDIEVAKSNFAGFKSGVVFSRVEKFRIEDNSFSSMRSDGVQVAESRDGLIAGNECGSTRIRNVEHPDCIQLWSRPTSPPTADITIRGNKIRGPTQGIGAFNHVRKGVDDGGFDRILIEDNDIEVAYPHGIALFSARDSVVRNNKVRTFDGARWQARITVKGDVAACGNSVAAGAGRKGKKERDCK